jgi:hypothetical protein
MRFAALSMGPDTHLDHLGVLASLFDIPLIVTDQKVYKLAKRFYPPQILEFKDPLELSLEYLADHYDILLGCGKFWALELLPLFETLYNKKMRLVFCPHGNSDKGYSFDGKKFKAPQDISLYYGPHMLELMQKNKTISQIGSLIRTGNYRFPFYLRHRTFFDELVSVHVFDHLDKTKMNILYAPTWNDGENVSSFFGICDDLINQLSPEYNLVIKLHPLLEEYHPAQTYYHIAKYEKYPSVLFLREFPLIYPLLNRCDIYLGDFSSIGYDFLVFDKPLYFFSDSSSQHSLLHRCGMIVPCPRHSLLSWLNHTLKENQLQFSHARRQTYAYAFGEERSMNEVKQEIIKIC